MNRRFVIIAIPIVITILTLPVFAGTLSPIIQHYGMCDASAAVPVGTKLFAVANDEDNTLRIYKNDESGNSIYSQDLSSFLQTHPKHPEADIEGATLINNRVYWITSHGANKNGKERPNRHRFFATDIEKTIDGKFSLKPIGTPFIGLVRAFEDSTKLKKYNLGVAAKNAPESRNGLNIEGLTKTPQGSLLIGFRNPVPKGKALLVPLKNPQQVITRNEKPKFGKPILLALNGMGIRSIEYSDSYQAYFIIAGPYDDDGNFQLYQWSGNPSETPESIKIDFKDLHPEALIVYPMKKTRVKILSDDGSKSINGQNCKTLANTQDKTFRSTWLEIEP
ncbi:DUF3616 domain-containing protein [Nitrosomonas supralitoralis]|uniref:DUF3616 domain-containing protein n=1 Tax=Nitrosomonas supralitoralis TaxID=2116706 RepID=A0A2P7NSH7_9PROT|nr:DUF3616 domain-containing protein [Nitrosomonas supralitoralis]PSJ16424.1 DUF3616 domain-containing protein [Nitrosomonas supralitoralis]